MKFLEMLGIDTGTAGIDWHMTPADTYGMFECRGLGTELLRSKDERYYYFYIDNWEKPARLCLMERGLRHAKVIARIDAPRKLIDECVIRQGKACKDKSCAIDENVRKWLVDNVIDADDLSKVVPVCADLPEKDRETGLPCRDDLPEVPEKQVTLRCDSKIISEHEVEKIVSRLDFFESVYHPAGAFQNILVDDSNGLTVTDMATGLMWQRFGSDLFSLRKLKRWVQGLNQAKFAGFDDWRIPTIEEALSLLDPQENNKGFHLHQCFGARQGYIFTVDLRKPGGSWFVDLRHARLYWAASTCFSGGFGRVCRSIP